MRPDQVDCSDHLPPTSFADLGVIDPIVQALDEVGITTPFPIQAMAMPIALTGTDMIGQARTGTGKTLAFGIALLQRIVVPDERDYCSPSPVLRKRLCDAHTRVGRPGRCRSCRRIDARTRRVLTVAVASATTISSAR